VTDDVKFGKLLGNYRARCGWSQEELAKKVGISRNAIVLWERHERGRQTNTHPQSRGVVLRLADELLLSKEERKGFLEAAGMSIEHWPAEYWNVPYQHNPYFVGRETILQSLRQRLIPGEKATTLTQSISGLGGIGKTQIAVEYAHRYGEQYEAVLWIQADSQEVAMVGLLRLATEVLVLPEQQEAEQQIAAVMRWLQKRHDWLLIFDNVEDPQAILSTFVPSKHQGSVLITTRRRDAGTLAHNEVLPLLSEDEAILFLLRRAGRIAKSASVTDATSTDFFLARDLCQLLGHLPLALDQAGAYIAENGCSLQRYRELYEHSRPKLLDRRGSRDHPDSVVMTFWLSWEQIQQRNALAGKALQFCAFLATDQIPEPLVQAGIMFSETEKAPEDVELDEALGLLYRYSLIERAGPSLSLHRLVLDVTQEVLSEEEQQQWMRRAIRVVNAFFPSGEHGTWLQCEILLPHALTCAKWISVLGQKKFEDAQLLGASGLYLYERGQYREAEPLLKHALLIREEQLEVSHTDVTNSLNNLAALYRAQGRYGEAELLYQRALDIAEGQLGASHPQTAASLNNLAAVYESQGRYGEAEPLYRRALRIAEKQLGASHPQTAASLNNLATLYENQGHYGEAEPLYQRALHIREEQLGASHPDTAGSLNNLALLYYNQGHYGEAEPLLKRALLIAEEQLGGSHPQIAGSLSNLAELYRIQGRYGEAEPLYRRAVKVALTSLGPEHPQTQQILRNLLALLSNLYTNGDMVALFQLLAQKEQDGNTDGEASHE
jgi:tetratricopeptide (TPR) repeat protein